jgi:hypothetical protein
MLTGLSREMGRTLDELLDALWSSEVTEYRAAGLIGLAQQQIAEEFAARERKARERSTRRTGRRRHG